VPDCPQYEREFRIITRAREAVLAEDEAFNNERMDEVHFTLSAMEFEIECCQREIQGVMANRQVVPQGVLEGAE
jgi:hypothetical protein